MRRWMWIVAGLVIIGTTEAAIRRVKPGGAGDGTSWANALGDLQDAIDGSTSGDDIWVAAGVYTPAGHPNVDVGTLADGESPARWVHFSLKEGVDVLGGFAGTETEELQRAPSANPTILSADPGTPGDDSDDAYYLFYHPDSANLNLSNAASLDGFILQRAWTTAIYSRYGAPLIRNCEFRNNGHGDDDGGALYAKVNPTMYASPLTLEHCLFAGNTGAAGGAIYLSATSTFGAAPAMIVRDCTFTDNVATGGGGAIRIYTGQVKIERCLFQGNRSYGTDNGAGISGRTTNLDVRDSTFAGNLNCYAYGDGGAYYSTYSNDLFVNCTFARNVCNSEGGAINVGGATLRLINCTVADNRATDGPGGVVSRSSSLDTLTFINSIFWGNNGNFHYGSADPTFQACIVQGGAPHWLHPDHYTGKALTFDPLLQPLGDYGGPVPTMPLGSGSPAMGMGELAAGVPETDARGLTREHPRGIDIGAWQEQKPLLALTLTVNQPQTGALLLEGAESFDATGYQELHVPAAGDAPAIEALPAPGFHFDHWQLDIDGQAEPVIVPSIVLKLSGVTAHTLATAHFTQGDYRRVRVRTHGPGTASVTDTELVPNTPLTIDFFPAPGARQGHVNVNGARLEPQSAYTIEAGHGDVTIDVFFNRTWHVQAGADGDGTSWEHAAGDLQAMIDGATPGDEVWVSEGTYWPTSAPNKVLDGPETFHFSLLDGISVFGGFPAGGGAWKDRAPLTYPTVFSGAVPVDGGRAGTVTCEHLIYHQGNTAAAISTALLDGVTLTQATQAFYGADGTTTFRNCVFLGNGSNGDGGAVYISATSALFDSCYFHDNVAKQGGAVYVSDSRENRIDFVNCTFWQNRATLYGGAVYVNQGIPRFTNCTISDNLADQRGGAFYNQDEGASPVIRSCIVWGNAASGDTETDQLFNGEGAQVQILYSVVQGRADGLYATGVINADPRLAPPADNGGAVPTMATGDGSAAFANGRIETPPATDARGLPRDQTRGSDCGAFQEQATLVPVVFAAGPGGRIRELNTSRSEHEIRQYVRSGGSCRPMVGMPSSTTHFAQWQFQDAGTSTDFVLTLTGITEPSTATAEFASGHKPIVAVTLVGQGSVSPTLAQVDPGGTLELNLQVEGGLSLKEVLVNAEPHPATLDNIVLPDIQTDLTVVIAVARIIHVRAGGAGDGSSWDQAVGDPQDAIDASESGDEIWIAAGTYVPSRKGSASSAEGPKVNHFSLKGGVGLFGGFPPTGGIWTQRDPNQHATVLSGDVNGDDTISGNGDDLTLGNPEDNLYHVFYLHSSLVGSVTGAVVDGFVIASGAAWHDDDTRMNRGGAVYCQGTNPTFRHCVFRGNSAKNGGAVYAYEATLVFEDCRFEHNSAGEDGGAVNGYSVYFDFRDCALAGNRAEESGGAIYHYRCDVTVTGCLFAANHALDGGAVYNYYNYIGPSIMTETHFEGNSAAEEGGALYVKSYSPQLTGCMFTDNRAATDGGAVYLDYMYSAALPFFINSTFSGNQAGGRGGAFFVYRGDDAGQLTNCTFYGNSAVVAGAAIYNTDDSDFDLMNCTFTGNHAPESLIHNYDDCNMSLRNSILWGNTVPNDPTSIGVVNVQNADVPEAIVDSTSIVAHCIIQGGSPGTDVVSLSPDLQALGDNGGPVSTCALGDASSAFGRGTFDNAPETDARGVNRDQARGVDLGAFQADHPCFTVAFTAGDNGQVLHDGVAAGQHTFFVAEGGSTPLVQAQASSGFLFTGWSDGVRAAERRVAFVYRNAEITASFADAAEISREVSVRMPRNHELVFDMTSGTTVADLKQAIAGNGTIAPEKQRLVFDGRELDNTTVLQEVGLVAGATVEMQPTEKDPQTGCQGFVKEVGSDTNYLQNVKLAFDANGDEQPEYQLQTDLFGQYILDGMEPGTYDITASVRGYEAQTVTGVLVADGYMTRRDIELGYVVEPERMVDVTIQVYCVKSGYPLEDLPVSFDLTLEPGEYTPDELNSMGVQLHIDAVTDRNGVVFLENMPKGYHTLVVNTNAGGHDAKYGWEQNFAAVAMSNYVDGHSVHTVRLKPDVDIELTVRVRGFDPVTEAENVFLERCFVELTGVSRDDPEHESVPPRTGMTAQPRENDAAWNALWANKVIFNKLWPINWRLRTKKLGYGPAIVFHSLIDSAPGTIEGEEVIDIALQKTELRVTFESIYNDPVIYEGMTVSLEGIADTPTAGIQRQASVEFADGNAFALFTRLLPGPYRVSADDSVTMELATHLNDLVFDNSFDVRFRGSDVFDAYPDQTHRVTLPLEPVPVKIHGILMQVDEEALTETTYEYDHKAIPGVTLNVQVSQYHAHLIKGADKPVTVVTNDKGEFTATVMPGPYGVTIPEKEGYWGDAVEYVDVGPTEGRESNRVFTYWPYYQRWPYREADFGSPYAVGGMGISSDHDLHAQFFIRKVKVNCRVICRHANDIMAQQVVYVDWAPDARRSRGEPEYYFSQYRDFTNGTVTMTSPSGQVVEPVEYRKGDGQIHAYFEDVEPGKYTFELSHPRLNQTSTTELELFDFDPPGLFRGPRPPPIDTGNGVVVPMYPTQVELVAEMAQADGRFDVWVWHEGVEDEPGEYLQTGDRAPSLMQLTEIPDLWFEPWTPLASNDQYAWIPSRPGTIWLDLFPADGTEAMIERPYGGGDFDETVYVGGPTPTPTVEYPQLPYTLQVRARNTDGANEAMGGVAVQFDDTEQVFVSGQNYPDVKTRRGITSVSIPADPSWAFTNTTSSETVVVGDTAFVTFTVFMRRAVGFRGTVQDREHAQLIPDARVSFTFAMGNGAFISNPSDATGHFEESTMTQGHRTYFVEVVANGYKPTRVRIPPEGFVTGTGIAWKDLTLELDPLPQPAVLDPFKLDRFGHFLPNVRTSGDQTLIDAYVTGEDGLSAADKLTATWTVQASAGDTTVDLIPYDDQEGRRTGETVANMQDRVSEIWIVDARSFPNDPMTDDPVPLALPQTYPQRGYCPVDMQMWLKKIEEGTEPGFTNVLYHRVTVDSAEAAADAPVDAQGTVPLWNLPPGTFEPYCVIVTRLGAITVTTLAAAPAPQATNPLTGVKVPEWLSFVTNALGFVASSQATAEELQDYLPEGSLDLLPSFTAEIGEEDGFVSYTYDMEAAIREGMEYNKGGLLSLAPKTLGVSVFGGVQVDFQGEDGVLGLGIRAVVTSETIDEEGMKPDPKTEADADAARRRSAARRQTRRRESRVRADYTFEPSGAITSTFDHMIDAPDSLRISVETTAMLQSRAAFDLTHAIEAIPYVGTVIHRFNRHAQDRGWGLRVDGVVEPTIAVTARKRWTTNWPRELEDATAARGRSPMRTELPADYGVRDRHAFGGDLDPADREAHNATGAPPGDHFQFGLDFSFAVGIEVDLAGRAGAEGKLRMTGEEKQVLPSPVEPVAVLSFEPNDRAQWPLFKRVTGSLTATLEAYLNLGIIDLSREYEFELLTIDKQLGTESTADFTVYTLTTRVHRAVDDPAVDFTGTLPQLARRFLPHGKYATDRNGRLVVFSDKTDENGGMSINVAGVDPHGAPRIVATTAGMITALELVGLEDGRLMLVWAALRDSADAFAHRSEIRALLSDDEGATWGDLELVSEPDEGVAGLVPVVEGNDVVLFLLTADVATERGDVRIAAVERSAEQWTTPVPLLAATPLRDWDGVVRGPGLASLCFVDREQRLRELVYDRAAGTGQLGLIAADFSYSTLSVAAGPAYTPCLFAGTSDSVQLFKLAPEGWRGPLTVLTGTYPAEVDALSAGTSEMPVFGVTVSQGGDAKRLYSCVVDKNGVLIHGPVDHTANVVGKYRQIQQSLVGPDLARVTAVYEEDGYAELRAFDYALIDGPPHRSDHDQDGVDDYLEFLIIDANPDDDVTSLADVLADADDDHDGYSNAVESAQGSNPADALSVPQENTEVEVEWQLRNGWNMLSLPYDQDVDALATEIGDGITPPLWRWDTELGMYKAVSAGETIDAMTGFWLRHEGLENPVYHHVGPAANAMLPHDALRPGWNLVGPGQEMATPEGIVAWEWDALGRRYIMADTLFPGKAYWIYQRDR